MKPETIHTQLRTILVHLYPAREDLIRVAHDAGVPVERVALDGSMVNNWEALLREAVKTQGVAQLLDVARQEYPNNRELAQAQVAFAQSTRSITVAALPTSDVHLLNFVRGLTTEQQEAIEVALGRRIGKVIHCPGHFDDTRPYGPQCVALVEQVELTVAEWQSLPMVVNPPGFVPMALCLLAELHGRMGYFPTVVRLSPIAGSMPRQYQFAEVMNLQALRDAARDGSLARAKNTSGQS